MVIYSFLSYYLAEYFDFSGVLAIFCFIIIYSNYSQSIISQKANDGIQSIIKTSSYLCEAIAFIYLGINCVSLVKEVNMI